MKKLPAEINKLIREYATDKLQPSPTALLLKDLRFNYLPATVHPVYWPLRLCVEITNTDPFVRFLRLREYMFWQGNRRRRQYMLHDFLPSYWSEYANTYDSKVYEYHDLCQILHWK